MPGVTMGAKVGENEPFTRASDRAGVVASALFGGVLDLAGCAANLFH